MRLEKRVSLILIPIMAALMAVLATGAWVSMYDRTKSYEVENGQLSLKKALVELSQLSTELNTSLGNFQQFSPVIEYLDSENSKLRALSINAFIDYVPVLKKEIVGLKGLMVFDSKMTPIMSVDLSSQNRFTEDAVFIDPDMKSTIEELRDYMQDTVGSLSVTLYESNGDQQMLAARVIASGGGTNAAMQWSMAPYLIVINASMPEITNGINTGEFTFESSQVVNLESMNIGSVVEVFAQPEGGVSLSVQSPFVTLAKDITPESLRSDMSDFTLILIATALLSLICLYLVILKILNRQILFPITQLALKVDSSVKSGELDIVPGDESNEVNALGNRYLQLMNQISQLANIDSLTELPNRTQFVRNLAQMLEKSKQAKLALFYLDLDRFKQINDFYGHSQGDRLLSKFGRALESTVAEYSLQDVVVTNQISRLSGDEFAIFTDLNQLSVGPEQFAEILVKKIDLGFESNQGRMSVGVSIGIAFYPDHASNADDLIARADEAMFEAKKRGRNRSQVINRAILQQNNLIKSTQEALEQSLAKDQFYLVYQPILNTESGEIVSAEVLLRSKNAILEKVGTQAYISVAETSGSIRRIDKLVFEEALKSLEIIRKKRPDFRFAVNISAVELIAPDFVSNLEKAISHSTVPASAIDLELTETALTEFSTHASQTLKTLQGMGFSLSLDDFGTGYNSFAQLNSGFINRLKIDKTFVAAIDSDASDSNMIDVVLGASKLFGLETIGEGVETAEQLDYLKSNGCEYYQGYYSYPPLGWEKFYSLIKESNEKNESNQVSSPRELF